LSAGLLIAALSKIVGGYRDDYWMAEATFYAAAICELVLAIAILSGAARWASLACIAFFSIGGILNLVNRTQPCGCMGGLFTTTWRANLLVSSLYGIAAVVVYSMTKRATDPARAC
jgi:hypothetical protein